MRVFTTILIAAALGLSLYNMWEVRSLKAELAGLRATTARVEARESEAARVQRLLREAERHSAKAKELAKKGDLAGARQEAQQSADKFEQALKGGADSNVIGRIRGSLEDVLARGKEKLHPPKK